MKTVSIIIPAYNAEKYILKCLESICQQTYQEIEILLIDDGSRDKTCEIAQSIANNDNRLKIFSNTNHGVSYSRNFGLDNCIGEYVSFVDADDIVAPNFIEQMVNDIEITNADMAAVGVSKSKVFEQALFGNGKTIVYKGSEQLKQLFGEYEGFLCNKLYKRERIEKSKVRLNENVAVCEDLLFNTHYLLECNKVVYNTGKKYFYRQIGTSASNREDEKKIKDKIFVYSQIMNLVKKYPAVSIAVASSYAMFLYSANYQVCFIPHGAEKLKNEIKKEKKKIRKYQKYFSVKQKIKLLIFSFAPGLVVRYQRRKLI